MPKMKFTVQGIKGLPAPEKGRVDYQDKDLPGFFLRVSAFGRIPNFDGSLHQAMNTVVIPLCKFAGLDPTDVRGVRFEFTVPGHATGKIQVDNIEFVD